MRIDLSSSNSFFLSDRSLAAGQEEGETASFGDVLKNCAEGKEENPGAELLQTAEGDIAAENGEGTAAEAGSTGAKALKLYLALDVEALDFIRPAAPEADPLTAARLVELIETSAPEQAEPTPDSPLPVESALPAEAEIQTPQPDQTPQTAEEPSVSSEIRHPAQSEPKTEKKAPEALKEAAPSLILEAGEKTKPGKAHKSDQAPGHEAVLLPTAKEEPPLVQTLPEAPGSFQTYKDNPADEAPEGQGQAAGGDAHQESSEEAPGESDSDGALAEGSAAHASEVERELSYEEIQALVGGTLERNQQLPARVREIVKELLNALADGHRWLLDQHRLIGLDRDEWQLLVDLFPPHFYTGLLRKSLSKSHQELPLFDLLQDLYAQLPPDAVRQSELLALWQPLFGPDLPPLLTAWIADRPPALSPEELSPQLIALLERWHQQQALPPGALGRVLQLALAYRHHPEKMAALFELSRALLHAHPLEADQRSLLAQTVYEKCFPRELTDSVQLRALLEKVLTGAEPAEHELIQICAGCAQGVLSYLPPAQLAPSLQELQDYVRKDLLGREELVPSLI